MPAPVTGNRPAPASVPPAVDAQREPAPGLSCPNCATGRLDPAEAVDGFVSCAKCGHRAAAGYVAEAVWLRGQDEQLQARLTWVHSRVTAGDPMIGPGDPAVSSPAAPLTPAAPAGAPTRTGHRLRLQTVLLSGGALLLVLAAVVFAAVAWDQLGAGGQIAALVTIVAALSAAAHGLRTSYRSTAEAVAAIAAGVAGVALLAAPRLGLGAQWMQDRPAAWAGVAFILLAGLALGLAALSRLVAWQVTVAAATVAAAFSVALAAGGGTSVGPLGCAGLAVAAAAAVLLRPDRADAYRRELPWVGAGTGGLAVLAGLTGYGDLDHALGWAGGWLVLGVCALALTVPLPRTTPPPAPIALVAPLLTGFGLGQTLPLLAVGTGLEPWLALPGLALCGAVALAGRSDTRLRAVGPAAAATLWVATLPVITAGWQRTAHDLTPGQISTFLGIVAVALLLASFGPGLGALSWLAAVLGTASIWVLLGQQDRPIFELFTASGAVLLLAAGLLHRRTAGWMGSIATLGPALAMLALPSALAAAGQAHSGEAPLRATIVILGGAALVVAGARLRVRAALLAGLAATLIAAVGQLSAHLDLVPRWLSLALAGVLLLVAGFSAERLARAGRHGWRVARTMW